MRDQPRSLSGDGASSSTGPAAGGGGLADAGVSLEGQTYTVGGKDFDEQLLLCQVAIAALESVGATVTDRCDVGGTEATRNALLGGEIDMYWEYNGTAWITFLGETTPIAGEQEQYDRVKERDLAENQIEWVGRTPFNNTYAFAVAEERAAELNLTTLSDMAAYVKSGQPGAVCVETEYVGRDDGLSQFLHRAAEWLRVDEQTGPAALQDAFRALLSGPQAPDVAIVVRPRPKAGPTLPA